VRRHGANLDLRDDRLADAIDSVRTLRTRSRKRADLPLHFRDEKPARG
jgi:hypothetical protein